MATVKAFIRTGVKKDFVNVRFRLSDGRNTQLFHVSEILINPDKWDAKKERHISPRIATKEDRQREKMINEAIAERKSLILGLYLDCKIKSSEELTEAVKRAVNPTDEANTVLYSFSAYIEKAYRGGIFGLERRKTYDVLLRDFERFLIINKLTKLSVREFNREHILMFSDFFINEYKFVELHKHLYDNAQYPKAPRSRNTVASRLKQLQAFFNDLESTDEIHVNPFRKLGNYRSALMSEQYDEPYFLKIDEFNLIRTSEVPAHLASVKDTFILHCALGCRVGDFQAMNWDNISVEDGIPFIHYLPKKTQNEGAVKKETRTPLLKFALEIIKGYDFSFPLIKYPSGENGYNKKIKELLKLLGITRKVPVSGLKRLDYIPICELASSKLARKTHVDIMNKVQVNQYAAGLHKEGSKAVERYTSMSVEDRFTLMCAAFGDDDYRVDDELNIK